jgi:hypothetical protein
MQMWLCVREIRRFVALTPFRLFVLFCCRLFMLTNKTKSNYQVWLWLLADDAVTLCACSVTKPTDVLCFVVWPTCCDGGKCRCFDDKTFRVLVKKVKSCLRSFIHIRTPPVTVDDSELIEAMSWIAGTQNIV